MILGNSYNCLGGFDTKYTTLEKESINGLNLLLEMITLFMLV